MTKQTLSILLFITLIFAGCATAEAVPTQISLPTDAPTDAATQTAEPSTTPEAIPTELVIPRIDALNPDDQAYLRFIHAAPDLGFYDVYIESLAVATNLDYGNYSQRQGIEAGQYMLRILPSASFVSDTPLYEQLVTITGGESLLYVITANGEFPTITTLSEPNAPLRGNNTRLMLLNAVQGADDLVMLVEDVAQTATTPYLQISETTEYGTGRVDFSFQNRGEVLWETAVDLRQRQNYVMLMVGTLSRPDTLRFVILNSVAPGETTIRFINASKATDLVDLYFGDNLFLGGTDYGEINVATPLLSGTYDLSIYDELADIDNVEPLTGTQFIANPDEDIVLILMGELNSLRIHIYRNNLEPTYDNRARVTFVHALESVPSILLTSTESELDTRLTYGRSSDTFDIDADQTIGLTWIQQLDDVQDIALETYGDFSPVAGNNYLYIFTGSGFDPPMILALDVGVTGFEFAEVPTPDADIPTTRPTHLRLVNMWENRPFVVRLDDAVIIEGIDYASVTNSIIIDSGEHIISFHNSVDDETVVQITQEFLAAKNYSVVVYNLENGEGDVLVVDDTESNITSASGGIRLVVLETEQTSIFGLGYSASSPNVEQPTVGENFRRSLPMGVTQIVRDTPEKAASETHRLPLGTYNIYIIDNDEAEWTYVQPEQVIEAQTLYNIFLREDTQTGQTRHLIIPYSLR